VERCAVLIHLIDITQEDAFAAYEIVRGELKMYGCGLDEKMEIIALNKSDAVDPRSAANLKRIFRTRYGKKAHLISAVNPGKNINLLLKEAVKLHQSLHK
jgi:GTP-binding protein